MHSGVYYASTVSCLLIAKLEVILAALSEGHRVGAILRLLLLIAPLDSGKQSLVFSSCSFFLSPTPNAEVVLLEKLDSTKSGIFAMMSFFNFLSLFECLFPNSIIHLHKARCLRWKEVSSIRQSCVCHGVFD